MRKVRYILALTAIILAGWSCLKEPEAELKAKGEGAVVFKLTSNDALRLQTKADSDDLLDGLRFENVLVILVDNENNVVGNVYKQYPYNPAASGNDPDQEEVTGSSMTEDVIHFEHLNPGNYTVYAYANIDAEAWQKSGEEISATGQEKSKTSGDFTSFISRELASVSPAPVTPTTAGESAMLLTGKAEVPVGLSVETHIIYLQRPVVRFRVYINNNTPFPVRVDELRFSHFNPDKAYLIDHRDESGVPVLPGDVTYGALPDYPILHSPSLEVAPGMDDPAFEEEYLVYETLLYENVSTNAYKVFSTLTLDPSNLNKQLSLGQRSFGYLDYETLIGMDEGEEVKVMVVNPQKSVRSGRIFSYISADNRIAWESAGYSQYIDFFNRAQAIYNETSYNYSSYSYSNANGYSGWDGLTAHDPKTDASFTYTGAKNTYFHTLKKEGGLYSIEGLAINPSATGACSGSSITGMRLEEGKVNDKNKIPEDMGGKLVRFIRNSDGKYIQANANWSANTPAKESNLMWVNDGKNQDRQFVLFGQYCAGGAMKRILKDSHKEVPLTYMSRNEDIKLVISVYYAEQEGVLDFDVDNSDWTTPTESSHSFN
ncbi:MAG: FimB/Mfa2 family fimbrial subunit [Bacteroidales bacterium]|nr:FimB/Mfa2 family fimbrial subunit [Bacteroidales bacterium]